MTALLETIARIIPWLCFIWVFAIIFVQCVGIVALFRNFARKPRSSCSAKLYQDAPHVTVVRPVKGLEPGLYECIASTFRQDYPRDRVSIRLCVEDETDPACQVLQQLIRDFPAHDAKILIENEDPEIHGANGRLTNLGPNPKIRNISRAYREAKGDIIWVIDCNVWVSTGVLGRMVDRLMGYTPPGQQPAKPYKFVHQMPLVVDLVDYQRLESAETANFLSSTSDSAAVNITEGQELDTYDRIIKNGGGRLDEMFMATSHVKFYCAINVVSIAPCIVGKSNMFRKSHLDMVTDPAQNPALSKEDIRPTGIDYFSYNICEDHLIGEKLWYFPMPGYQNHGIMWGDLAFQPMAGMSISAFAARRVRWLRARKFTVLAATLVEPGVESLLCSAYFAYFATKLSWFYEFFHIPPTWTAAFLLWFLSVTIWMVVDRVMFTFLHTGNTVDIDHDTPRFAKGTSASHAGMPKRPAREWIPAWLSREFMALPIWTFAVLLGGTVSWRGKVFRVRLDTTVEELTPGAAAPRRLTRTPELERARVSSKDRQD